MVKTITTALIITLIGLSTSINAYAQQSSFDLKKASNQYNASGTVSVSKNGTQFTYSAVVKDLPSTLPANGIYYILWD